MLVYNEDWLHFIWTRDEAGVEVTESILKDYIYSFKNSQVTDFAMNVNGSVSTADSKVLESFLDKYMATEENGVCVNYKDTFMKSIYTLIVEKKIDMYSIWIDALKEIGINPWISIRMNDCHGNMLETDIRKSRFIDANPEYHIAAHRERTGYFDKCLDYRHSEVRNRMKDYIDEMLTRYDVYGLELDMMRDTFFFQFGLEETGFSIMNDFMKDIYKIIKKHEGKYGHKIRLMLILPSSPNLLIEKGIDIINFIDNVDYITIISRWETTDTDMPIELWKQLLRGTDVKLGGGQQLLFSPYRGYKPVTSSVEMAFGQAVANISRGCDFVYLYNYMDFGQYEGEVAKWLYESSIRNDCNRPLIFGNIGKLDTLLKQRRSHVVTYSDFCRYDLGTYSRLPIRFGRNSGYEQIKIPVGVLPRNANVKLVLGINQHDTVCPEDIVVYVNTEKCDFSEITKIDEHIYENDCYVFDVKVTPFNIMLAEIKISKNCTLEYVEIEVSP